MVLLSSLKDRYYDEGVSFTIEEKQNNFKVSIHLGKKDNYKHMSRTYKNINVDIPIKFVRKIISNGMMYYHKKYKNGFYINLYIFEIPLKGNIK